MQTLRSQPMREDQTMRIAITGASRGIGLEFARQYLNRGERVFATCRQPDRADGLQALAGQAPGRLTLLPLDVTRADSIEAAFSAIEAGVEGIDLLINNAGIYYRGERPGTLDAGKMLDAFAVNSIAPVMVAQRALGLLKRGEQPKIVNITSQMGSLARKRGGRDYSYCASKAALNMLSKALAFDLRASGITVVMMHPGWVQTDMGGQGAPLTPEEAIRGMVNIIDGLTPDDTARFLQWDGKELPW
jgi:NAD(P)-dependent dehydrogenase (short-subunit alcohol dehydrogenase family)